MAERTPYALFFVAVMLSTWFGGRNPGLLAIAISVLVTDYFIISPRYSLLPQRDNILQVSTFVCVALLINFLTSVHQRNEKLLSESEERHRVLFESISLPLWVYDLETLAFLTVNEAAIEGYGYSRTEFLSKTIKDIRPAEDVPALLAIVGKAPRGFDVAGAWRHQKKDGTIIDVEITSHAIDFAGRRAEIVLAHDITERKRAEEAREQLAAIVESSEASIISMSLNGRIISWNASAERMYGYTAMEAIGQHVTFIMPPERYNELAEIIEQLRRGEQIENLETVRLRKDGTLIDVLVNISPVMDDSGQVAGASTIASDITERKQAKEALESSERRYRRLFESAFDGILILDVDSGQIVDVNPYLSKLLGFSKEELLGKELWEIGVFKDIAASKAAFEELQQRGYIRYENLPLESHKGVVKHVEFVSNIYQEGEGYVIQCNIRDITERKLAGEQLEAKSEELAALTQQFWQASRLAVMGELAASIAHELNNPLATVSLRVETLLSQLAGGDPQRRSLEIVEQEVERMGNLVGNLLQFSRRSHQQISTFDVREEITNTIEFIHYHLRSRHINVVCEFADGVPTVQADRQQLRQLFLNLLTNASDATPQGGRLTLRVAVAQMPNGARAVGIEFADTGVGIKAEDLSKIWEPFFTTKPEGKGTGLGLAICRRIVEEHRGTITIESEAGQGTTVRIVLPATTGEEG